MNCLCWNYRGPSNSSAIQALKGLILSRNPNATFLSETKVDSSRIESIRGEIKIDGCFAVDRLGRRGGLVVFWKGPEVVILIRYSLNHVDLEVVGTYFFKWRLMSFLWVSRMT
ncbi:hypothetical protein Peur_002563 [Populus x canadensis]